MADHRHLQNVGGKIGRPVGATGKRRRPANAPKPAKGRRLRKRRIPPLLHTFDQPKPKGAYFDKAAGDRAVRWIERHCRQHKGRWAGQPLYLLAWQSYLLRQLFGWKNADGTRLYRECYLEVPRKNGKSTLASAVGLYLAHGDDENGPEIVFAAQDKDQARVCYDAAKLMVEASPMLFDATLIYAATKTMELPENAGGWLKAISSDAAKQFGLNLHGLIFDELMTQSTRTLWNALTTAQGAREQPLTLALTTAGWDTHTVCFEQRRRTEEVMAGNAVDPTFLGVVYGAPEDADWTDPKVWAAANPSLGVTVQPDFLEARCQQAMNTPTEQNAFRTLFLSQWVGQERRFIDMKVYDRNDAKPAPPAKVPAFGGLDLSSTTDLSAFVIAAGRDEFVDFHYQLWLPEAGIAERERLDRVPYMAWAEQGFLNLIPGATIDQGYIRRAVSDAAEVWDLIDVGFDPWNASQLVVDLEREGIDLVKLRQGFATLSAPTKELLRLLLDVRCRHGGHPVARWSANNVAARTDANGNVAPDKSASRFRIDPTVGSIFALDGFMRRGREVKPKSVYETRSLAVA